MDGTVYSGNDFSIDRHGDDWTIWRLRDRELGADIGDCVREDFILTTDAMDELRDFFAESFADARGA